MIRKLAFAALYGIFGVFSYVLFLYLTFPSDTARDRVVYEANKAGVRLQLMGFRPSFPFGVSLSGVDIYGFGEQSSSGRRAKSRPPRKVEASPEAEGPATGELASENPASGEAVPAAPAPGGPAATPGATQEADAAQAAPAETPLVRLDRLRIGSLLPLLSPTGALMGTLNFDADLYGGEVEGSYGVEGNNTHIVVAMKNVDLSRYPMKGESYDLSTSGTFGLATDLSINKEKIRESTGNISLSLDGLTIHKGSKMKGFDIPLELAFKVSGGTMEVKNGRAELAELKLESTPLTILIDGSIMLNTVPSRSRFNLKVSLKFGDELKVVSAFLPENARSDDGFYHYILSGPLDNLRTRPDRLAARRKDRGGRFGSPSDTSSPRNTPPGLARPPLPGLSDAPGEIDSEGGPGLRPPMLDDAERERLREERRKRAEERRKRREELRQRRLEMSGGEDNMPVPGRPAMGLEQEGEEPERPVRRVRPYDTVDNDGPEDMVPPEPMDPGDEIQPWEGEPQE